MRDACTSHAADSTYVIISLILIKYVNNLFLRPTAMTMAANTVISAKYPPLIDPTRTPLAYGDRALPRLVNNFFLNGFTFCQISLGSQNSICSLLFRDAHETY